MKVYTLTTEGDNCPMQTRVFATEAQAYAALRADLDEFISDKTSNETLTEVWAQELDGPACIEEHEITAPSDPLRRLAAGFNAETGNTRGIKMSTKITFKTAGSHSAFHGMCEGMSENARDDDETARADALDALITATAQKADTVYPLSFELPRALIAEAKRVLENVRDNEELDAENMPITIETVSHAGMTTAEALAVVLDVASRWGENTEESFPGGRIDWTVDGSEERLREIAGEDEFLLEDAKTVLQLWRAVEVLTMVLNQKGCEHFDSAVDDGKLTTLCDLIIFG